MPHNFWPKPFKYFKQVRFFLTSLCILIVFIVASIFTVIYNRTNDLMLQRVKEQAVAYHDLIIHAKMWNYDYGGVYVEKKGSTKTNSYLKGMGIEPDIQCRTGQVFTKRNHAIMIKEISRRSEGKDGIKFRIVGNSPIDPENAPDNFEKEALRKIAKGAREVWQMDADTAVAPVFRYLRPMYGEKSCLECHREQTGYGDVVGAVSITIPVDRLHDETKVTKLLIILAAIITTGLLVITTYFLTWRLVIKLDETQLRLKKQAATDELTGLHNRRTIMKYLDEEYERAVRQHGTFCIIIVDIDHFKEVNDTFGHPFGDLVLKQVAARMRETLRRYDRIGRIGGEEFIIITPATHLAEAIFLAERVLQQIREEEITDGKKSIRMTVSAGVAFHMPEDRGVEDLLKRADEALYRAKKQGRDRAVAAVRVPEIDE